jgi:hypothetical protein
VAAPSAENKNAGQFALNLTPCPKPLIPANNLAANVVWLS